MFPTTNWTAIEGGRADTAARRTTLGSLARAYRRALVIVAGKRGLSPEEAEDVVQELFAKLVERDVVRGLDRRRGRLRAFLRVALDHAIAHHVERRCAAKRGGGVPEVELTADAGDAAGAAGEPDALFERWWRAEILDRAFARLASEYRGDRLDVIVECFAGDPRPLAELAEIHGTTAGALKSMLHRARRRFRAIVHDEVAATIGPDADLASELRALGM